MKFEPTGKTFKLLGVTPWVHPMKRCVPLQVAHPDQHSCQFAGRTAHPSSSKIKVFHLYALKGRNHIPIQTLATSPRCRHDRMFLVEHDKF